MESTRIVAVKTEDGKQVVIWEGLKENMPKDLAHLKKSYRNNIPFEKVVNLIVEQHKRAFESWPYGEVTDSSIDAEGVICINYENEWFYYSFMPPYSTTGNVVWW